MGKFIRLSLLYILYALLSGCDSGGSLEPEPTIKTFTILDKAHQFIDFGTGENNRDLSFDFELPEDVSDFNEVELRIKLDCPSGGCDPWDRLAIISVVHENDTIEIARYITPYGIGCGYITAVTPYRNLLSGKVNFISHIDTWVNTGWLVTLELDYNREGNPFYDGIERIEVENIWTNSHLVYGDPLQSVDQPQISFEIPTDAAHLVIKIVVTGHGQGNSENAAEFLHRQNRIWINDNLFILNAFADCSNNTGCPGQLGNWSSPRFGWCPGRVAFFASLDIAT